MGSTYSLAERVRDECRAGDGRLDLDGANLSNEDMTDLADGLRTAFQDDALTLKALLLPRNNFDDEGLATLANVLKELPQCRKTLKVLHLFDNVNITTLAPLSSAGTFDSLTEIWASGCSLSGASLPPELCFNLPALEKIDLSRNMGGSIITLTTETLRALPRNCDVPIYNSIVRVKLPDDNFVLLPTRGHEPFGFFSDEAQDRGGHRGVCSRGSQSNGEARSRKVRGVLPASPAIFVWRVHATSLLQRNLPIAGLGETTSRVLLETIRRRTIKNHFRRQAEKKASSGPVLAFGFGLGFAFALALGLG